MGVFLLFQSNPHSMLKKLRLTRLIVNPEIHILAYAEFNFPQINMVYVMDGFASAYQEFATAREDY